jgi:hypothetical protein
MLVDGRVTGGDADAIALLGATRLNPPPAARR